MFELSITNEAGEVLRLYPSDHYDVGNVEGLTPVKASINASDVSGSDGSSFSSAHVGPRNIVIPISPRFPVGRNRTDLYRFLRLKSIVKVTFENERSYWINGYVESLEGSLFDNPQTLTASILCLDPYLRDGDELVTQLFSTVDAFEFPFAIASAGVPFSEELDVLEVPVVNKGDEPTGIIAVMTVVGKVVDPVLYDSTHRTRFAIKGMFAEGDVITLNTRRGEKSVTLRRAAEDVNLINDIEADSVWFSLERGTTMFALDAAEGAELLDVRILHYDLYQGA